MDEGKYLTKDSSNGRWNKLVAEVRREGVARRGRDMNLLVQVAALLGAHSRCSCLLLLLRRLAAPKSSKLSAIVLVAIKEVPNGGVKGQMRQKKKVVPVYTR